jgi:hypothetical protein
LGIPIYPYLGAGSGSQAVQTAKIMVSFEEVCEKEEFKGILDHPC